MKQHFIGVVHKDADTAYGISFPDLPGCFSAADTLDGLKDAASEALALWLEDNPEAEARDLDALASDPKVQALAEGSLTFLPVPVITLTGRTVKANLTLDAGLLQAIDETAKERGMTRSAFIADVARKEVAA